MKAKRHISEEPKLAKSESITHHFLIPVGFSGVGLYDLKAKIHSQKESPDASGESVTHHFLIV